MIEDTSFILDLLAGEEGAVELLSIAEAERRPEKVSAITLLELYEGIGQSDKSDEEKAEVLDVLHSKTVLSADADLMRRAGTLSGRLLAVGQPIDREDCIVGATALRENEPVATRNVDRFERIDDLQVIEY